MIFCCRSSHRFLPTPNFCKKFKITENDHERIETRPLKKQSSSIITANDNLHPLKRNKTPSFKMRRRRYTRRMAQSDSFRSIASNSKASDAEMHFVQLLKPRHLFHMFDVQTSISVDLVLVSNMRFQMRKHAQAVNNTCGPPPTLLAINLACIRDEDASLFSSQ